MTDLEFVLFEKATDWEDWLDTNCEISSGVWLKSVKKTSDKVSVSFPSPSNASVPEDLQQALDANPVAGAFFGTLS